MGTDNFFHKRKAKGTRELKRKILPLCVKMTHKT